MAKLEAAQRAFARGSDGAALNQLGAFDNAVLAQSGKKIPVDLAAEFLEGVEEIADCL